MSGGDPYMHIVNLQFLSHKFYMNFGDFGSDVPNWLVFVSVFPD